MKIFKAITAQTKPSNLSFVFMDESGKEEISDLMEEDYRK